MAYNAGTLCLSSQTGVLEEHTPELQQVLRMNSSPSRKTWRVFSPSSQVNYSRGFCVSFVFSCRLAVLSIVPLFRYLRKGALWRYQLVLAFNQRIPYEWVLRQWYILWMLIFGLKIASSAQADSVRGIKRSHKQSWTITNIVQFRSKTDAAWDFSLGLLFQTLSKPLKMYRPICMMVESNQMMLKCLTLLPSLSPFCLSSFRFPYLLVEYVCLFVCVFVYVLICLYLSTFESIIFVESVCEMNSSHIDFILSWKSVWKI